MTYELTIDLPFGRIEIEADNPKQLERRVAALDLSAIKTAVARARRQKARKTRRRSG